MNNDGCAHIIAGIIIIGIALAFDLVIGPMQCGAKFPNMETRWGLISGCQVRTTEGWVPAENFRVM